MLADAEAKNFDVLIVDDLSRLSRDDVEMKQIIRRFRFWGLRIIGISDGFDSDSKGHKIQAGVRGLINEMYLDDLRDKTHRGLTGQALKGYNCGGKTYGYKHSAIEHPTQKDEYGRPAILAVTKAIDEEQAKWVRKIFEWYADGHSPRWIANELNKNNVPSPRNSTWAASAIYGDMNKDTGLLNNDLYIGKYVWNRSEWIKDPDTGKRKRIMRLESEWVINDMPELRIIEQALWERVKERQKTQKDKSTNIREALHRNARTGASPKYVFSGLLKCGCCGSNFIVTDYYRYGCAMHKDRGASACSNSLKVSKKLLESKVLGSIKADLFTQDGMALFKKEVIRVLTERKRQKMPNLEQLRKTLKQTEAEIENIMTAIKAGIITSSTKAELEKAESKKNELQKALNIDVKELDNLAAILPNTLDRYQVLLKDITNTTQNQVGRIRNNIGKLIGDEIVLTPNQDEYLTATLQGNYAGLLELVDKKSKLSLVAGAGFEPAAFRL